MLTDMIAVYTIEGDDGESNPAIEDGLVAARTRRSRSRKHGSGRRSGSPDSSRSPSILRSHGSAPVPGTAACRYRSRGRGSDDSDDDEPNECKHCKVHDRKRYPLWNGNDGNKYKCPWNPTYKGWRTDWMCSRLGITFINKNKFSEALGGTMDE